MIGGPDYLVPLTVTKISSSNASSSSYSDMNLMSKTLYWPSPPQAFIGKFRSMLCNPDFLV